MAYGGWRYSLVLADGEARREIKVPTFADARTTKSGPKSRLL